MSNSEVSPRDYLEALYSKCSTGHIVFVAPSRNAVSAYFNVNRLDLAAQHIEREPMNLFIKVNVMDHEATRKREPFGIGGVEEVKAIVSFHIDVDAGKNNKYLTREKMLEALDKMPLKPTAIIESNGDTGGFHAYWMLEEPHYIDSPEDRQRCQDISSRWLEELRRLAAPGTIDSTADLCRVLRPVGALRKSNNRVRAFVWDLDKRYKVDDFLLPPLTTEQPQFTYTSEPRSNDDSIIEQYLHAVGLNSVEAILRGQGYSQCRGRENFWIRDGSESGAPTGQIHETKGKRGFTVKSGAADPLSCTNARGGTGNWYSVESLFVSFHSNCDASNNRNPQAWTDTAKFCHKYFDDQKPKVELSEFMTEQTEQEPKQQEQDKKKIFIKARRMDTVTPEKISWWWPNRIPRANLIMFAGQGGGGKSSVCCDLVARHTTGQPFPNDTEHREPENVSIINCEDDAATIQRPRLDAAGADCSRVHLIDSLELAGSELWIDFANYSKPIEDFIVATKSTLLVVDPISGHIGGKKQNDTAEVREVLQKLQAMAKRTGCTIVAITHSPKNATSAQSSIIGSQAFVSCARAAFAFVKDKDDPTRRIMLNAKSNYSADESGLAYRIVDVDGIGRVEWDAQPVTEHPDSFFTDTGTHESSSKGLVDKAAGLLMELITDAMPKKDIDEWARAQMISGATLRRAKEKNGHVAEKRSDGWYWLPVAGKSFWDS